MLNALTAASGARAVARCDALGAAPFSDSDTGLYRAFLTPAHRATLDQVAAWMGEAGLVTRIDGAGNLIGRLEGAAPDARALIIGSHLDSVRDAGRYDGPLGVMLGIELAAALQTEGRPLPFAIEVIGFGDEEGSRFAAPMLCSRAIAGTLQGAVLDIADAEGVSLGAAFEAFGLDIGGLGAAAHYPATVLAYLEPHIEQGPVLEAEGLAVGVVTGIAAQVRFSVTLQGRAGHAGTTSMPLRRDALAAAAECMLAIERIARSGPPDLVATVGRLNAMPGAVNVIPGKVAFSIDVRAGQDPVRDRAAAEILAELDAIAAARGVAIAVERVQALSASPCDPALTDLLAAAVADTGAPPRRLVSGAGHDAMVMSALCPTAMLFIRCAEGISHNPAESVEPGDAEAALQVMRRFVDRLGETLAT